MEKRRGAECIHTQTLNKKNPKEMDQQVNDFSLNAKRALLVITLHSCGPCKNYMREHLPNTEALFRKEQVPMLHVDSGSLSPYLRQELVPYTPVFHLYVDGEKVATADVHQSRAPAEMLRWVVEYQP